MSWIAASISPSSTSAGFGVSSCGERISSGQRIAWEDDDVVLDPQTASGHGDQRLGFNDADGRFYRLWQHRRPEPMHTAPQALIRRCTFASLSH
ncbi:hypothetical protein OG883_17015 [Streptomyces sp. NBC_01142]|uniref:hypothetical protein n=1 Tax=Streptomyces sp. NBC_01142 TaxID=2975865 RepID=UPI00224D82B1|nr:hypothetical protein [Streptomyces sp. NBC_01142]MCX4821563.1 hypothetical protein [Streptomyces sp. NBC_01142]